MRSLSLMALACALALATPAAARPYTVDDLLNIEQRGAVQLTSDGRWGVIESFAPWSQAARYDLDWWSTYGLGRLQRVDLRDGSVRPLLPHAPGSGYVAGPFSPSGGKVAVTRLTGHVWELGVVTLASGDVRWLGLSPELSAWGRSITWRTDDELVVIAQPDNPIGHLLGYGWQAQARLQQNWAGAAAGRLAVNAMGSGRYRDVRAKGPAKRLLAVRATTGEIRDLARGGFIDLEIAPGGRTLAAIANGEDAQALEGMATTGTLSRRRVLTLVDLETHAVTQPCQGCDVTARLLSWSASGKRLLVHTRGPGDGAYRIVDARSGTSTPISELAPAPSTARDNGVLPSGGWVGETAVIFARPAGSPAQRADWYALEAAGPRILTERLNKPSPQLRAIDGSGLVAADGEDLWRIPIGGQAHRLDVRATDIVATDGALDSERLAVAPPSPDRLAVRQSGRLRPFTGAPRSPLPLGPSETLLAAAAEATVAIVSTIDPRGVERVLLRTPQHPDRELARLNSRLALVDPAKVRPIHHLGPDGQPLTSWLYLPPHQSADQRPPLVVVPYPGHVLSTAPDNQAPGALRLHTNAQLLAAQGYAVLVPSLPYASGREPMDGLADQVLAIVDAAAKQAPVDADRLAIWGHSYGGYAALALATQSPRFKAIIASAPASDLVSSYGKLGPYFYAVPEAGLPVLSTAGWSETGQGRMGVPPWKDIERYRRNSPISFVDRITAPVMLIHGDMDKDPEQSQQMFTSLYRQNKDAVLLLYRGESHVIHGPANVRDQYGRVLAFLAEHIGAGDAP